MLEMLLRQRQDEAHAEQLSQTIIKFRKKTAELNSENEDLKDDVSEIDFILTIQLELVIFLKMRKYNRELFTLMPEI